MNKFDQLAEMEIDERLIDASGNMITFSQIMRTFKPEEMDRVLARMKYFVVQQESKNEYSTHWSNQKIETVKETTLHEVEYHDESSEYLTAILQVEQEEHIEDIPVPELDGQILEDDLLFAPDGDHRSFNLEYRPGFFYQSVKISLYPFELIMPCNHYFSLDSKSQHDQCPSPDLELRTSYLLDMAREVKKRKKKVNTLDFDIMVDCSHVNKRRDTYDFLSNYSGETYKTQKRRIYSSVTDIIQTDSKEVELSYVLNDLTGKFLNKRSAEHIRNRNDHNNRGKYLVTDVIVSIVIIPHSFKMYAIGYGPSQTERFQRYFNQAKYESSFCDSTNVARFNYSFDFYSLYKGCDPLCFSPLDFIAKEKKIYLNLALSSEEPVSCQVIVEFNQMLSYYDRIEGFMSESVRIRAPSAAIWYEKERDKEKYLDSLKILKKKGYSLSEQQGKIDLSDARNTGLSEKTARYYVDNFPLLPRSDERVGDSSLSPRSNERLRVNVDQLHVRDKTFRSRGRRGKK